MNQCIDWTKLNHAQRYQIVLGLEHGLTNDQLFLLAGQNGFAVKPHVMRAVRNCMEGEYKKDIPSFYKLKPDREPTFAEYKYVLSKCSEWDIYSVNAILIGLNYTDLETVAKITGKHLEGTENEYTMMNRMNAFLVGCPIEDLNSLEFKHNLYPVSDIDVMVQNRDGKDR